MVKIDSSVVALAEDQIANRTVPNALPAKYLGTAADRHDMLILGKTQQLKRNFDLISMLGFSSTAVISWEIIPVFLVWNLIDGGTPIVFWGLIIGAIGMSFVYASLAEMASQYHWVSEFAPPSFQKGLSYCVGWLTAIAWQVYLAGTCFIVGSLVQGLIALNNPNYVYHRWHGTLLTIAVVVLSATYNVVLAKRLPILGQLLLVLQVVGLFGTVIPLWVTAPKGQASQVLFEVENNGGWDNKGLSAMIGLAPIVGVLNGYDCIAHMCKYNALLCMGRTNLFSIAEEINDASKVLPIAMISSVSLNIVLLLTMGITLIFCLGDLDNVVNTSTGQPFIQIYYNATQSHSGTSVMVAISIILIVFCGVNEVATSSRQIW
ncbi:hypothetical protein SLS60_007486 [Paraconiothyrium brasiliense]|uniref:Amino acid transporter n=1 Tax=Paraconiothyrium brasiliense TaxID=300254 RepID=A0ABR3R666_9PLEO